MRPTIEELYFAYLDCRQHKRNTASACAFEASLARNLAALHRDLCDCSYRIGRSRCFISTHPRPREIWAAGFRDRVVHHLIYNRIAHAFYRSFSPASCACIPGRGTLYAKQRIEKAARSVTRNWSRRAFYLKMDLSNFFVSIDKRILWPLLEKKMPDAWTSALTHQILFHDPVPDAEWRSPPELRALVPPHKQLALAAQDRGLPIGNLSSQFFANVYLNVFDQFVAHQLKPDGYARYVDDMVLMRQDRDALKEDLARSETFLRERLNAILNPRKTILQPVARGVDFVGYVIKPWRTVARGNLLSRAYRALIAETGPKRRQSIANSYLGILGHCSGMTERHQICNTARRLGHVVDGNFNRIFARAQLCNT
jgi:hypothetical protein